MSRLTIQTRIPQPILIHLRRLDETLVQARVVVRQVIPILIITIALEILIVVQLRTVEVLATTIPTVTTLTILHQIALAIKLSEGSLFRLQTNRKREFFF